MAKKKAKAGEFDETRLVSHSIKRILDDTAGGRQELAYKLIGEMTFMEMVMMDLKTMMSNIDGVIETFEQGKQKIVRESPAFKAYNAIIGKYLVACRQLCGLMGEPKAEEDNSLVRFLSLSEND